MSGRSSITKCAAVITTFLVSLTCTDLQAATRTKACLLSPNASSPAGKHWYYRLDLSNHHKCWYLHATITYRSATTSRIAPSSPAATSGDPAPRFPHTRLLSLTPKSPLSDSVKPLDRNDLHFAREGKSPPATTLRLDETQITDAAVASSPAAAKSVQPGDAASSPQESLQVDRSATTEMALAWTPGAAPSPALAKPVHERDAPVPEEVPQVARSATTEKAFPSRPGAGSSPDADPRSAVALVDELGGNGSVRSNTSNGIAEGWGSNRKQTFLFFAGLAIFVFVISLVVIRRPAAPSIGFRWGRISLAQNDQKSYISVDDSRGPRRNDSSLRRMQPETARTNGLLKTSSKPPRKFAFEDIKAAPKDYKPTLIYRSRSRGGPG